MNDDRVYVLVLVYHCHYVGVDPPEVFTTLELAKEASYMRGPWVTDPHLKNAVTAYGDDWDAWIYMRHVQRVPHEPRGIRRIPRCKVQGERVKR